MPTSLTPLRAIVYMLMLVVAVLSAPDRAGAVPIPIHPAAGCPATIAFGQTLHCALNTPGETASFGFSANPSDYVLVRMIRLSGAISPDIRVIGSGGPSPICEQHSEQIAVEISGCLLAAGGNYTIVASDFAGTEAGEYALALQRVNNPAGATVLNFGQTQQATVSAAGELDTYTFAGIANDTILVRVGSAGVHPHLRIYTPNGIGLCENAPNTPEIANCVLTADGAYTLVAGDQGGGSGSYGIVAQRLNNPGSAAALAFGQTALAEIGVPGEVDTYTFTGNLADTVVVRVGSVASPFTPHIRLYGPDGNKLCERFSSDLATDIGECLLPKPGLAAYTVLVNDYAGADIGSYGIALQRVNMPAGAQALAFGQLQTASLTAPGQLASYTFTANNGDIVLLRMGGAGNGMTPQIRVYGPDGNMVCNANGNPNGASTAVEIPACDVPAIGTYTVLVNDYNHAATGGYGLMLQRLNNPANATELLINQIARGAIAPGQFATYTFVGKASSPVRLVMSSPASSFYPSIRLYQPDGALRCQAGGSPSGAEIARCLLPSDGTYTLIATTFNGAGNGDYALTALCLAADCGPSIPLSYVYLPLARR